LNRIEVRQKVPGENDRLAKSLRPHSGELHLLPDPDKFRMREKRYYWRGH
jgi:hypothetical protein